MGAGFAPFVAQDSLQAGFKAKILVANTHYSSAVWTVDAVVPDLRTPNVEGALSVTQKNGFAPFTGNREDVGFITRRPGLVSADVMVRNATFDVEENPFSAPLLFALGLAASADYYAVQILPAGMDGPKWDFPYLMIVQLSQQSSSTGLSPITFMGRSHGKFGFPFNPEEA